MSETLTRYDNPDDNGWMNPDSTGDWVKYEAYRQLETELADMKATFDLRWNADMRARKMWQNANPGNELTWPDHADLVVWLMEQLAEVMATER